MQQNGGIAGAGSLGAGIGALMQTLGNLNQGPRTPQGGGSSVFNRLGNTAPGPGKPATPAGLAGQSPWQKNNAAAANNQGGSPAVKKDESPQKVSPDAGKGGAPESPAAAKPDDSQGFKTPQNQTWQQRNQSGGNQSGGGGGRWGPSPNQNQTQQNSGGRNQGGGGGGGNWQQRSGQNQQSPASGGGQRQNQQSPAAGGGQQGNWQGGQSRSGGQWGQNRGGDKTSPQQQNDNDTTPRRGGRQGGRGGGGGRNESPQNRNYGGNRSGGGGYGGGRGGFRGGYDKIRDKVMQMSGPQIDLPPMEFTEKKFNANSRLFVGNLPRDLQEEELREMFTKYGELGQFYFNKEGSYAFINFDFRCNAEKAKRELQSHVLKGRTMKVRVASVTTGVRVKNMSTHVSNELLHNAFSVFGEVESCRVLVNERGKATGEGIVIFADKKAWTTAIRKCEEECYFLTSDTRPCVVEPLEVKDEEEGQPEISMPKNQAYQHERQQGPRFADPNSFEFDYGQRYKRLFEIYKERKASLDRDFAVELDQLEAKMAIAKHDFETVELRRELERREADMDRLRQRASFAGLGDSYGSGYGGAPPHGGGGAPHGAGGAPHGGAHGGARSQQGQGGMGQSYGGPGGPGPQSGGGYGGSGSQPFGSGYGGSEPSQEFRAPPQAGPQSQGGYGENSTMQGEDYARGMKRPAIGELEPDTASGPGIEAPNKFERRF